MEMSSDSRHEKDEAVPAEVEFRLPSGPDTSTPQDTNDGEPADAKNTLPRETPESDSTDNTSSRPAAHSDRASAAPLRETQDVTSTQNSAEPTGPPSPPMPLSELQYTDFDEVKLREAPPAPQPSVAPQAPQAEPHAVAPAAPFTHSSANPPLEGPVSSPLEGPVNKEQMMLLYGSTLVPILNFAPLYVHLTDGNWSPLLKNHATNIVNIQISSIITSMVMLVFSFLIPVALLAFAYGGWLIYQMIKNLLGSFDGKPGELQFVYAFIKPTV